MTTPRSLRFDSPTHIVLQSRSSEASELAGYLLASRGTHGFGLLEIRAGAGPAPGAAGSYWGLLVAPERHMITFAPELTGAASTVPGAEPWPIVRADEPDRVVSYLPRFLASPEAASHALRQKLPLRDPLPVLITNGALVARSFPDDPMATGRLLRVQKAFGLSVVLAADDAPRKDYGEFDFRFSVHPSPEGWGSARMRCTRAPPDSELRPGDEQSLGELDGADAVIGRWSAAHAPPPEGSDPEPPPADVGT